MLFQSSNGYVVLSGLLGAIISAIIALISICVNNNFQLKREEQQRIWQEKSDQEKWYREKVYASYTKAIQILTEIIKQRFNEENDNINLSKLSMIKLFIEFDSEYIMIIRSHPARHSKGFEEKISEIDKSVKEEPWIARDALIEIMEQDLRIKPVKNNFITSNGPSSVRVDYNGNS
jgi:hypothetical protein